MRHCFYLAWHYLRFHYGRTLILLSCVSIILFLPLALQILLDESEQQLLSRADSTPLVVGAKGSALDLVMNTLYFDDEVPEPVTMAVADAVSGQDKGLVIPMYVRYRARGFPIVGTSLDYFDARSLEIANGRQFAMLGEIVVGAAVAEKLDLSPGDNLVSSPETLFDLAGIYPLKMQVVGTLARSHTADDRAVFADVRTTWVIEGLGHGHEDLARSKDTTVILNRTDGKVTANAKLMHYNEITPDNIDAFHFHGDNSIYPLTGLIVMPDDARSGTILRGSYADSASTEQVLRPSEVVDGLLQNIFRIKNMIDAVIVIVGFATLLAMVLVFSLSFRLREREFNTVFKLGGRRRIILGLLASEVIIIAGLSMPLVGGLVWIVGRYAEEAVRWALI